MSETLSLSYSFYLFISFLVHERKKKDFIYYRDSAVKYINNIQASKLRNFVLYMHINISNREFRFSVTLPSNIHLKMTSKLNALMLLKKLHV